MFALKLFALKLFAQLAAYLPFGPGPLAIRTGGLAIHFANVSGLIFWSPPAARRKRICIQH